LFPLPTVLVLLAASREPVTKWCSERLNKHCISYVVLYLFGLYMSSPVCNNIDQELLFGHRMTSLGETGTWLSCMVQK